jgi:hypothetical protein
MGQQLCVADDDGLTNVAHFFFRDRFEYHLGSDSRRIAHRDAYTR